MPFVLGPLDDAVVEGQLGGVRVHQLNHHHALGPHVRSAEDGLGQAKRHGAGGVLVHGDGGWAHADLAWRRERGRARERERQSGDEKRDRVPSLSGRGRRAAKSMSREGKGAKAVW